MKDEAKEIEKSSPGFTLMRWPYTGCYLMESSQILNVLGFILLVCRTRKGFPIQNRLTPSLYLLLEGLKANQETRFIDKG